jgi:hypothetical protein
MASSCLFGTIDNVPPWIAGHPAIPDTFTRIHYQSSIHAYFHMNHNSYKSSIPCLCCKPCSEGSFACGILSAVGSMLPSADAPASVAPHKRLVARVVSGVGSLGAPDREDQATANFQQLGRFTRGWACEEVPDWSFCVIGLGAS